MCGIVTCVYHKNQAKVGKSKIRGSYGISYPRLPNTFFLEVFEPKKSYQQKDQTRAKGVWKTRDMNRFFGGVLPSFQTF